MNHLTLKEGEEIFHQIASDDSIPFAHTSGPCFARREAMIGKCLEKGMPLKSIERVLFMVTNGIFNVPQMDNIIEKTDHAPFFHIAQWTWHTSPQISLLDGDKVVKRVFDPAINPLEMLTPERWADYMKSRSTAFLREAPMEFEFLTMKIGKAPQLKPRTSLPHTEITSLIKVGKHYNFSDLRLVASGMITVTTTDWDTLSAVQRQLVTSAACKFSMNDAFNVELANGEEVDMIDPTLIGKTFVDRYRAAAEKLKSVPGFKLS